MYQNEKSKLLILRIMLIVYPRGIYVMQGVRNVKYKYLIPSKQNILSLKLDCLTII